MLFSPKKIKVFGLDISDSSIKIMQIGNHNGTLWPTAYSILDIPKNLIVNHTISNEDKLADYISKAVRAAKGISTKYVVVSVPETKSFVRILKLPAMPEQEVDRAIRWELEQDIPMPIEQVYLDWEVVKHDGDSFYILVMATPRDYVDSLVNSLKMANLKPVAIELESHATARALISQQAREFATLIIDMSTTITSFVIVSGSGYLEYTSNVPIGGNNLTESIAAKLGIDLKEAEKLKIESGLLGDSKKGNVKQAILPILDNLVDEIRNVVSFHKDHSNLSKPVNKIVLCGGGAALQGLSDYISARLNVGASNPVDHIVLGDSWVNVVPESLVPKLPVSVQDSLAFTTAIGLALRGGGQ
jgi:type IV pilus assembly protein PilM